MLLTAAISGAYGVKIQGMLWKSYLQWMHYGNKVEKEMRILQNSNSLPAHTRRLSILR